MKHRSWMTLSGFVWIFVGVTLLYKGLVFITESSFDSNSMSSRLAPIFGSSQKGALFLIAIGLFVGLIKGRFVLTKTAKKTVARISQLPLPIRFKDAYAPSYWFVLALMMMLGMILRYFPTDIRGLIDVAIGSALINGALFYFKAARAVKHLA